MGLGRAQLARTDGSRSGVASKQRDQLGGSAKRIGDQLSGAQGERGIDAALPDRDEVGGRREGGRVALSKLRERGLVGRVGEPKGERGSKRVSHEPSLPVFSDQRKMLLSRNPS
jgi:hypothetical protein